METYQKISALGMGLMILCLALPFIIIKIGGPLLDTPPVLYIILVIAAFVTFFYGFYRWQMYLKQGNIIKDERVQKIWDKSRSYTLYVTIPFIGVIVGLYREMNLELNNSIAWLVIIQVVITQLIFRWYFNKKKDI